MTLYSRESLSAIHETADISLGMAQLAVRGLSEDWWLKHLGDVHWQMIATAMGQAAPVFRDVQGRMIYAAFCATHFEQLRPDTVELGGVALVHSSLWQAGRSRLQSIHEIRVGPRLVARLRMVSTFVTHDIAGVNKSVTKVMPDVLPLLPYAPDAFAETAARRARRLRAAHRDGGLAHRPISQHQPLPDQDFNAVGLLYFPSFTRIAAQAETTDGGKSGALGSRLMLYFGNIENGEHVVSARLETGQSGGSAGGSIALFDQAGALLAACEARRAR